MPEKFPLYGENFARTYFCQQPADGQQNQYMFRKRHLDVTNAKFPCVSDIALPVLCTATASTVEPISLAIWVEDASFQGYCKRLNLLEGVHLCKYMSCLVFSAPLRHFYRKAFSGDALFGCIGCRSGFVLELVVERFATQISGKRLSGYEPAKSASARVLSGPRVLRRRHQRFLEVFRSSDHSHRFARGLRGLPREVFQKSHSRYPAKSARIGFLMSAGHGLIGCVPPSGIAERFPRWS